MKGLLFTRTLLALLCLSISLSFASAQRPSSNAPLTNASVVKLVKAGFKEKTVVSIIGSRPTQFDLSPDRMIEMKRSGVSERIILAMLARQDGAELPDDFWTDDPGFDNSVTGGRSDSARVPDSSRGSMGIFGSSGGVRGSTRSRGASGSVSGDTETVGSATVRIIRPPAEAGAPAKLEKTPSLTNDSIVELVEAGFSEGTIIRRIENSPVEFDFSLEKIDELRKHRVTDKILAAMKAAMGNDSSERKSAPPSNDTPKK